MLFFQTSYKNKKIIAEINCAVGRSFGILDRFRMKGIGSRRLKVEGSSPTIKRGLNAAHYISLVSVEMRPQGLIVYFRKKIDNYVAVFPYSSLEIELKEEHTALRSGEDFIELSHPKLNDFDFFKKVIAYQQNN